MKKTISEKISFFESFIPNTVLCKDGVNLNIWCPFCKHRSKSKLKLSIQLEKGYFHCWLCDKKGSSIDYLVSKLNANKVKQAKEIFPKNTNKTFDLFGQLEEEIEQISVNLPETFEFIAEDKYRNTPDVRDTVKYAINRGFDLHKLWMLRPGVAYCNEFRRCLILPSYDAKGNLNYYTARRIDANTGDGYKYKNAQVPKKSIIFNEINIDWEKPLTLVEGPLDLVKTNDNSTCLLGSSLTEDMRLFQQIVKNRVKVNLALDSDVYHKTLKIAKLLSQYDIEVDILDTRGHEDVGDMSKDEFNNLLNNTKQYKENDSLLSKIRSL